MRQKLKTHCLFLLLLLIRTCLLPAQSNNIDFDYNFMHYDIEQGLPSNEAYIFQEDDQGYLWIGTDKGVARFNGYEFKTYTTSDGLTDNTILRMALGPDGKLWMLGFNNKLCYVDQGKIYPFEHNVELLKLVRTFYGSAEITIDRDYNFLYRALRGAVIFSRDYKVKQLFEPVRMTEPETHHFFRFDNRLQSWCSGPIFKPELQPLNIYFPDSSLHTMRLPLSSMSTYYAELDTTFYFYLHGKLLLIDRHNNIKEKRFENEGLGMLVPIGKEIWACSMKGILVLDKAGNIKKRLLPGQKISSIYEDKNKNIWVSTLNNGIYQLKSRAVSSLKKSGAPMNDRFPVLLNISDRVIAVHYTNETACASYFNEQAGLQLFNQNCNYKGQVPFEKLLLNKESQFAFEQPFVSMREGNSMRSVFQKEGVIYAVSSVTLFRWEPQQAADPWKVLDYIGRGNRSFFTLFATGKDEVLLGGREGLFRYAGGKTTEHPRNAEINSRVQDIEVLNGDTLLGTRGNGLKILRKDTVLTLTEKDGLLNKNINNLFKYKNEIWIATDRGVNVLRVRNDSFLLEKKITVADGINSTQIRQLILLDSFVYLGMEKGLGKVDLRRLSQYRTRHIPVYITNVRINDTDTIVLPQYVLNHTQRSIRIDFEAIDFRQSGSILYKYRMQGVSERWDYTNARNVLYSSLPTGSYVFEVAAQYDDGRWSEPVTARFFIAKPY